MIRRFIFTLMILTSLLSLNLVTANANGLEVNIQYWKRSTQGTYYVAIPFESVSESQPLKDIYMISAGGCKIFTKGIDIYNSLQIKVATYAQEISWRYDGQKITSLSRTRWGTVNSPIYQFNGHIGNTESGGKGQALYRAWTQGSFCEIAPGMGCVWNFYPWVDQYVFSDGSYWGNAGW